MVIVFIAFGFAAFFLVQAIRTPWRPEASGIPPTESHVYRDRQYHLVRRIRPWGRARFLLFATANALIGWWAWWATNLP